MNKFCVDCKHLRKETGNLECGHPRNVSPVTGMNRPVLCSAMRDRDGACGPEGSLFETAPSAVEPGMSAA